MHTLLERSGVGEVIAADRVIARGFYHLTVGQQVPDEQCAAAGDGGGNGDGGANGDQGAKQCTGYLEIWQGSLPIEPMRTGDIVLRLEGGHTISATVELYAPETRVADFVCTNAGELDRLVPMRHQ